MCSKPQDEGHAVEQFPAEADAANHQVPSTSGKGEQITLVLKTFPCFTKGLEIF